MTIIIIISIIFLISVNIRRDISSVIFNRIGFSLGLGNIGWIVLLLLTLFILNNDIGLQGGLLYTIREYLKYLLSYQ